MVFRWDLSQQALLPDFIQEIGLEEEEKGDLVVYDHLHLLRIRACWVWVGQYAILRMVVPILPSCGCLDLALFLGVWLTFCWGSVRKHTLRLRCLKVLPICCSYRTLILFRFALGVKV